MLNKKFIIQFLAMLINCVFANINIDAQRCQIKNQVLHDADEINTHSKVNKRTSYSFQMVFHVMYSKDEENIGLSQILSQVEVLNEIYDHEVNNTDLNIPSEFRKLKTNPHITFCLAEKDPLGQSTLGVTRTKINDISLACRIQFTKRSIMHQSLGGIDIWNPDQYINIYVVNRDQCNALGEAIFPWNVTKEEDGIIIDYRALGFIGAALKNSPFHQGKTLIHEMGHYFGLKHLSDDAKNCQGDDLVADTPPQSLEYFGCPSFPQSSCGNANMTMNYMSLVNDACMHLFTKDQVSRMHQIIDQYKTELIKNTCASKPIENIDKLIFLYNNDTWQIKMADNLPWSGQLELFNVSGKLIWQGKNDHSISISFPQIGMLLQAGIYFLRIHQDSQLKIFKLIKYS